MLTCVGMTISLPPEDIVKGAWYHTGSTRSVERGGCPLTDFPYAVAPLIGGASRACSVDPCSVKS